ncbi:nuclease-related domain-containing protein [Neobacillus dielmonensis]|uniref:nuclease-related domain-containing protein n=1 Tax=Neobacillus dielmonensis TaxID=1347369 RepID=UPI0005AAE907|nr:nuclease-related domain-containing protein [Neobacillus dielmonensis]
MELYKPRTESLELRKMRLLNKRMALTPEEKKAYLYVQKGYEGEVLFDRLTEKLQCDVYVLNDLLLKHNNSLFQIDTLLIYQKSIMPIEIKNQDGDCCYYPDKETFTMILTDKDMKNPLDQLKRSKQLLHSLLKSLGVQLPLEGYVVFVNPHFTLYQAPLNKPIIYPNQLDRFMDQLNKIPSTLGNQHKKVAAELAARHIKETPFTSLPQYSFGAMKKGSCCVKCDSYMVTVVEDELVCHVCGEHESIEAAVVRNVEEIRLLFPEMRITTNLVYEWCGVFPSKKMIRRILLKQYKAIGYGRWFYFE